MKKNGLDKWGHYLAEFLKLDTDEDWIANAFSAMNIKSGYNHDSELLRFYQEYVSDKGSRFQEVSKSLLVFIKS
ncbi:MAG: hypothetical protein HQK65_05810 [Desulfamplus sp.]|nr:hypothetical protein [Desulfamplus sp.]